MEKINNDITHYLTKEKTIQTNSVYKKTKEEKIINCCSEESADKAYDILKRKLSGTCEMVKEQIMKPKMGIVEIDNSEIMDIKKLQDDINERNFKEKFKEECKILDTYVNNKNKTQSVVIEMPAKIYKYVKENKSRIFVGYQRCKIFDLISVQPCYNCARYGHSGATCKNAAMCTKCSMPHMASLCSETVNSACAL